MDSDRDRITVLDMLRGVAALIVVIWHFRWYFTTPFPKLLLPFYLGGWAAVDLFFVISGFILTKIYYSETPKSGELKEFAIHRFARIYPLHFLTLIVVAALIAISGQPGLYSGYRANDLYHFILNLFLLQWAGDSFNAPSWSISTEMFANVFLAIAIFYFRGIQGKILCVLGLLISIVLFVGFLQIFSNAFILQTALGFLSGCLLAFWHGSIRIQRGYVATAIFIICVVVWILWMLFASTLHARANLSERVSHVGLVVIIFPAMIISGIQSPLISRISGWRFFTWLGEISYSVYLWHFPVACILVLTQVTRSGITAEGLLPLYLATVLLVSHLSFIFIEGPARRGILSLAGLRRTSAKS